MATAFDVAAYILAKQGGMSAMKLHKLLYYSQAWSLVWDDKALFDQRIEAWANGPVVREVYRWHRGYFRLNQDGTLENGVAIPGTADALSKEQRETIDAVLEYYGDKDAQWLSDLTHAEDPWRDARGDLPANVRSEREIRLDSMSEYYSSL